VENKRSRVRQSRERPNMGVEKVKGTLIAYRKYFTHYFKKPVDVFLQNENEYLNGVITIVIFALLTGISYFGLRDSFDSIESSFFQVVSETFLFIVVSTFIALLSLYVINKLFGPELELQNIIGIYGTHLFPIIVLVLLSNVFILMNLIVFGNVLLVVAVLYAIFILPLYLLTKLLAQQATNIDPHYSFISYIIVFSILFSAYLLLATDLNIGDIVEKFNR
jgi:hypothetical protein